MSGIILVPICLALGFFLRRRKVFSEHSTLALNAFVTYVSLPALIFLKIHDMAHSGLVFSQMWLPISMAWIQFGISFLIFWISIKIFKQSTQTSGALLLAIGLGNTSFVGFPMLEALYGKSALATGILVDQPGTFLVLSTLGVLSASIISRRTGEPILRRILYFPPFSAMISGFALASFTMPDILASLLDKLGSTLIPIALVSVGAQLRLDPQRIRARGKILTLGLLAKLILIPAIMAFLYLKIFPYQAQVSEIIITESAMASMVTGGVLASEFGFDAELSSLMVGLGIPISILSAPLWAKGLHFI